MTDRVAALRRSYLAVAGALPWNDAAWWEDDPPQFPDAAPEAALPSVTRVTLTPDPGAIAVDQPAVVRYDSRASGSIAALEDSLRRLADRGLPLVVLHTDLPLESIGELAALHPRLQIIIESGPSKILYFIEPIEQLLLTHPNLWLCTANLCNWLGIERLCARGLGERLLFGTHSPRFSAHAAMGPIVMARLDWRAKCAIAGNNLRRLLGVAPEHPEEVAFAPGAAFVVDAHGHTGPSGRFPAPDAEFGPEGWLSFMDHCAIAQLFLCPMEAIDDPAQAPGGLMRDLISAAPGRFRYFEVFHPAGGREMLSRIERSLGDPACAGIKIHPSMHGIPADDDAYAPVFALASRTGAAVLTHSWEASATNPTQHLSLPERFERHLQAHPNVRLVLGHAGGRPSTMATVVRLCAQYQNLHVDLAGDYYDAGLIDVLCSRVGPDRVLFASDVNWIDPRANLAPVLASSLSDAEMLLVLRENALRVYSARSA